MKRLLLIILPTILLTACGSEATEDNNNTTAETNTEKTNEEMNYVTHAEDEYGMTHEQYEELAAQGRPPKRGQLVEGEWQNGDDELDYVLTLKEIGDGAYPNFSVTALPERSEDPVSFYLNAEDYKGSSINDLMENIDKAARIVYYIRSQNHMTGTTIDGTTEGQTELDGRDDVKTVTGKWIAEEMSQGDLPDDIIIETANGLNVAFPAFIGESDVAMNGKTVTVHYVTDEDMVISYIKLINE